MKAVYDIRRERSWTEFFLSLVGIGESRGWTIWLIIASFLGLIANFVVLLGCMSPPTRGIYLFRVSSDNLIEAMTNLTDVAAQDLALDELPRHWYYGLSGTCVIYQNDDTFCERAFPPVQTMSLESMLTFAVKSQLPNPNDLARIKNTLNPWSKALSQLKKQGLLPSSSSAAIANLKASAGLAVFSAVLTFALIILAVLSLSALRDKIRRWMLYVLASVDAAIFVGAGVLAIYAMDDGPRAIIHASGIDQGNESTYVGPGFFALFGGAVFKLISIEVIFIVGFIGVLGVLFLASLVLACCMGEDKRKEDVVYVYHEYPTYGDGK